MIIAVALAGVLVLGLLIGLAMRGCLLVGDRWQLDLAARRLLAEQQIDTLTRNTLAAMRRATRESFTSNDGR